MKAWLRALLCALTTMFGAAAWSHEMSMAEMGLREVSQGEFMWQWGPSERPPGQHLTPQWPEGCRAQDNVLRCGPAGLTGTLSIDGVGKRYSAAIVKVLWLDGQESVHTLTAGQPTLRLYGSADDRRGIGEIASAYAVLGVEHILSGFDHLLFVIGLLFLVGFNRRLALTITAFTFAHSLTLASSALGWLTLRPPPVEATIALSIMLVASEALRQRVTWARRWPAAVAFLFGLVHGLGFAGALKEIGLPDNHLWVALLTFNVGVEVGQLMVVSAAWLAYRWMRGSALMPQARLASLYGIGTMAAFWTCERVVTMLA